MTTHALKSDDFDKDSKSFTLHTSDSYFIRPTAVYVKGTPATHAEAVTVIVWFHGFFVDDRATILKQQEAKLLPNLKSCSLTDLIFIAPFMGNVHSEYVLDENKQKIPLTDKKGDVIPGKFKTKIVGSPQYRVVENDLGSSADDYLIKVLEGLANFLDDKGQKLTRSDGKEAKTFTIKNLILACHSGGGVAMKAYVKGLGSSNTAALKGCWCFDCLYNGDDPDFWFKRSIVTGAPPFYEYYFDTADNAKRLLELMGHPGQNEFTSDGSKLNVIDNSGKSHYRTASEGFLERLNKIKLP
jgi:hypothetical protein